MSSKPQQSTHERLGPSANDDVKMPSERSFAHVFAVVFALIGLVPLAYGGGVRFWSVVVAAVILMLGYLAPAALRPFNSVWFKFGMLLHAIVNPLVLGAMFFLALTPMALVMRLFGKRFLKMNFDTSATTYWINRTPPGPTAQSARQQF
jgi:Saxitoxin biosynthesis operon protein SxtJ